MVYSSVYNRVYGIMRFKQQADGFYRFRETYKGKKIDLRAKNSKELEQKVYSKRKEIDDGICNTSWSVNKLAEEFLKIKKPIIQPNTYKDYKINLDKHVLPMIGNKKVIDVKSADLQKVMNKQAGKSISLCKHIKAVLTGMFNYGIKLNLILVNPAIYIEYPKTTRGTFRSLTKEEREAYIKVCEEDKNGFIFLTLLLTGVRPEELLGLNIGDVDAKKHCINISRALRRGDKDATPGTKTGAGQRSIPLSDYYISRYKSLYANLDKNEPMFKAENGKRLTHSGFRSQWLRHKDLVSQELQIEFDAKPYDIRHTFCTDLQSMGVSLNQARVIMGHSKVEMTAQIYSHYTEEQNTDVLKKINEYGSKVGSE